MKFVLSKFRSDVCRRTLALFFIVYVVTDIHNVSAEMYKWIDEQGIVHYSDHDPKDKARSKSTITPTESRAQIAEQQSNQSTAIAHPSHQLSRHILIPEIRYAWRTSSGSAETLKLGVYYIGTPCSLRGAIKSPGVYTSHPAFFPTGFRLAHSIQEQVKDLGYSTSVVTKHDLVDRLLKTNGVELNGEITAIDLKVCAPLKQSTYYLDARKIRAERFNKNRVELSIHWQLRHGRNREILFESDTDGYFDHWNTTAAVSTTLTKAVGNAVAKLFSDQRLIAFLAEIPESNDDSTEQNLFSRLLPFLNRDKPQHNEQSKSESNAFLMRNKLTTVLGEISPVKMLMKDYYRHNNNWPYNKSFLGIKDSSFENHQLISDLEVKFDGTIQIELKADVFGRDRVLKLIPDKATFDEKQLFNLRWDCFSNLPPDFLPQSCQAI